MSTLQIRRLEREDLPTRMAWFNTPSVYTQMTIDPPFSLADTEAWFARNALNERRRDFSVLLREGSGQAPLVAMMGLVDVDRRHRRAELYIVVQPERTGRGIGRRSVQWLCNFGFLQLNLVRISVHTLAANEGARRLYERLGFSPEGVLRKYVLHNGQFADRHLHGLLRSEWEGLGWRASAPLALEVPFEPGGERM